MDFHLISEKNIAQVESLWDYCFEKKDSYFFKWYFKEYCLKQNAVLGGFNKHGVLSTMVHFNPHTLKLRGMEAVTSYLVGVATDPAARGRRATKELFEMAFAILKAQGRFFVILMPEYAGVYLPYQFAFVYSKHRYELPLRALSLGEVDDSIELERVKNINDFTEFSNLYESFMQKYNGFVMRTEREWSNFWAVFINESGEAAIAYRGDMPVGYMLYQRADKVFKIVEMVHIDADVKKCFLRYARQHVAQCDKLEWLAEADDLTYLHFQDQSHCGSVFPFMMARIIDARKALELLPLNNVHKEGSLTILITDDLIKSNNMLLNLNIGNKAIKIEDTFNLPDIEMDISAFTQLYFGQFSLSELAAEGTIAVHSEDAGLLLSDVLPKCNNYINEYY